MQFENGNGFDNTGPAPTSTSLTSPGRASRPVRRLRSSRSPAAARAGRTSSRPTSRASTSPTCWPTPLRSAAASRRRSPRRARAQQLGGMMAITGTRRRAMRHQRRRHGIRSRRQLYLQRHAAPDIVANLKVSQGWGSAQVSGVAHYVTVTGLSGAIQKTWGWGVDAGVSFNLPSSARATKSPSPALTPRMRLGTPVFPMACGVRTARSTATVSRWRSPTPT